MVVKSKVPGQVFPFDGLLTSESELPSRERKTAAAAKEELSAQSAVAQKAMADALRVN